ncbi:phosphatidylinositol phosphatase PTPRQ-like [Osmerus mordax]|uniref:phosphatidylinositol phosphatase PTPRQ n=1 Tax=Osmerus mordax TaxID=8014 RepID=UPI0035108B95
MSDPDVYLVNFRTMSNHTEWLEPVHHTSCSPECRTFLRLAGDPGGYDITLTAIRHNASVATKTFHIAPLPSLKADTTTTTALLTCTLQTGHTLTTLSLHDTSSQTSTHTCQTQPSGTRRCAVTGLQAGTRYSVQASVTTFLPALNITSTQRLHVNIETAKCPIGWLASGRSCYSIRRRGLMWVHAQSACRGVAGGVHLVDLKTQEDLLFMSTHLLTHNSLLLLWTALNDRKEEGGSRWSDGSVYNQTNEVTSSLLSNQTDCFALQRNATGPGYFLTPFFCGISLPFICHHQIPPVPPSFSFEVVQVTERTVELGWGDLSPLNASLQSVPQVCVQYEEEDGKEGTGRSVSSRVGGMRVPVSLSTRGANMTGLSPGRLYSVSLTASDPAGASWSLGRIHTVHTRPLPPQNVSVGNITANQITVHWVAPESQHAEHWRVIVRWVDMSSGQERVEGVHNVSRRSRIGGRETYSAVIGQLESFRKYKVGVHTVTEGGVESCGDTCLIRTALRPPSHLTVSSRDGNLTVCWTPPPDEQPDGYEVKAQPGDGIGPSPLWVNHSSPDALWVHEPVCVVVVGPLTPGQTYEVGVVSLRERSRSLEISTRHTTEPCRVPLAVPLSVGSESVVVFVQTPHLGLFDGVKVCACEGRCDGGCGGKVCDEVCEGSPFPPNTHNVTLGNLSPGVEYRLSVYTTSKGRMSPPYHLTHPIRTCLAPPSSVREGEVTVSSVELQWDPAPGHGHTYEVICLDCDHTFKVLKVSGQRAVFTILTPGRLYHFRVRTEKERFTDSPAVTFNITAAPSPVEVMVLSKTTTSVTLVWGAARGVVSGYILSIKNQTSNQQLNLTSLEHRFEDLAPGSYYTLQVSSTNGERRSNPATVNISTIPEVPQEVMLIEQGVTSVFVSWRPPPGEVKGYKLSFGLVGNRMLWRELLVQGTSLEIGDLTPGSDYGLSVQTLLGSDSSQPVSRDFYTRPAGVCSISLLHVNSSCAMLSWDTAVGHFDFHRVTLAEGADTRALSVSKEETVATLTALRAGCSYNVSVERVRRGVAGAAASLTVTTIPERPRGVRVVSVSARAFSLRWEKSEGCVDQYHVSLQPSQGRVSVYPTPSGHVQANVVSVSPGTQFTVTVTADSSSNIGPLVSRIVNTNLTVPGAPFRLEGKRVGSKGLLLSWSMPPDTAIVDEYVIRYKEMCPHPDPSFTQVTSDGYVPETLHSSFTPGSTYNIQVAGKNSAGVGPFSKSLYIKTAEASPGLVNSLSAFAENHTFVAVTWYLPEFINGLITKFAVKAKHARTGQTVRTLELNAEDIMTGALPHCNDAADILSRGTPSPSEVTASSPPITLSAVPPAAAWSVPISVGVDKLRPYTAYVFEVSAFTSEGEGQIASTMVRMPESAPEDPPQNLSVWNVTSRSISLSWDAPSIITGRFSYVVYLYGPMGLVFENSTGDLRFIYSGLTPYTSYRVDVRAKSAGEVGPETHRDVLTPAEAPSAVQDLKAVAEDSVSVRVSWRIPAQPNGLITHYSLLVLSAGTLLQDITLYGQQDLNGTGLYGNATPPLNVYNNSRRSKRSADFSLTSSPPAFTVTLSDRAPPTSMAVSSLTLSASIIPNHSLSPTPDRRVTTSFLPSGTSLPSMAAGTGTSPNSAFPPTRISVTSPFSVTSAPKATPPPWLTNQPQTRDMTSYPVSPGQPRLSTRAAATGNADVPTHPSTQAASTLSSGGVLLTEKLGDMLLEQQSHLVTGLSPFTEYTFTVTAATVMGEGPSTNTTAKTREQVPSSVVGVSYQNISSTSILVRWSPPQSPNGLITHYTLYGQKLYINQALQRVTQNTSILLTGLEKYTWYKLRVAASTAVGESSLSDKDNIFVVTPEDEPDSPPRNLTVVETTPSTATLAWSPPVKANGVIQQYEVLYENQSYSAMLNSSSARVTLSQLKPSSYYNVTVKAYTRHGHGNQTSLPLHMLSGEDVPGSAPYDLSYVSVSPSEVNVTWRPPLVPNGVITHYSMQLWNSSHYLNLTSPTSHATITHLRKYARYRLTVQAHTRVGPGNQTSDPLNITTLEDVPDTPPQFLQARKLSDYQVELSWEAPLEANSDILYYLVRVWNETSEQWQNVTETVVVIDVDSESRYNASVSSWTRLGDGGVLVYISFTTTDTEPFDPPQNVSVVNVTSSAATLLWNPPTQPNGIITHYTIQYMDNTTEKQQRAPVSVLAPGPLGWLYSYRLSGLLGGSNYSLWMTSSTIQGDGGVRSAPLTMLTPENVPSDPVHNLSAQIFSSTAIIVSWDPPQEPNGRPFYLLTLQEAGHIPGPPGPNAGPSLVNKTITKTTTDNVFLFTKLRKYFPYVVTVTPATGAGPAHNHTSTLHLRTDDDIPSSAPVLVSSRNLSSSSLSVAWQRPLEANGEITEYLVTLFGPGGSNTTQTPNTTLTLTQLQPYTSYNLSITAATRKGSGPALLLLLHTDEAGPMSPPRNLSISNHTASSVWLSWEPSLEPNGVVTHYGFRIHELNTQTVSYQNSSGPWTAAHLAGFRPHSSYEISVCSYTRVGHGDQFSLAVSFTTNESVSDAVRNLSCSGVSWDSVQLTWEPPTNPNGQILFYQIQVDSHTHSLTHQAPAPQYVVSGLHPDEEYTLTVTPVNSAGPGEKINCTADTQPESVPGVPRFLNVSGVTPTTVTLHWAPPLSASGMLTEYHITVELISTTCQSDGSPGSGTHTAPGGEPGPTLGPGCVDSRKVVPVNGSGGSGENPSVTLRSLAKYRQYRFRVVALTNAGEGEPTPWSSTRTLAGNPDAPPRALVVTPTSNSLRIQWDAPAVLSGPTSYLIDIFSLDSTWVNRSLVRAPGEMRTLVVSNLTAFTRYSVTVTAFTGLVINARTDGKASPPLKIRTLEEEPRDPPTNVTLLVIPEEVTRVLVNFAPPEEPNGNISSYTAQVYSQGKLQMTINDLVVVYHKNHTLTAVIHGLKGGLNYSIRIAAVNGAGLSPPSPEVKITTGIKAPAKPSSRPQALVDRSGVAIVTSRSISILMPHCYYSDDNGPISSIQVIVAESGVMDSRNLTNWQNAYLHRPTPYLTDSGFPNPSCARDAPADRSVFVRDGGERLPDVYVIGEDDHCLAEERTDALCNGPLKPNTVYVFRFRATNINGQYTDSDFSEHVRTAVDGLLTRDEQIILGVLLSFFLAVLLILIIYASVRIRQRQKEGGTYSPREAEIIETKFKLDQLITVADLELKEEKLHRYSSFFFRRKEIFVIQLLSYRKSLKPVNKKSFLQHVEDLCANDNSKFQEEFSELPKLLQDLATSDADLPWNRSKNRFTNIKPYNNNRVKLLSEPGMPGSDYINASFISGYLCPNEFIATQGPLPGTVADFWRMIWETRTRTIAMLTQCYEKGRIRCHQYWPEDNKPVTVFGDIIITKLTEDVYPDWTVRALKVERHGDYMVVHHFNYTSWPEHGVPESSSTLIQFVKAIRANRHDNTTMVVHCSAGVGRTGVFIALDHLIQHISDHDFVDVYGLVAELRSERMCMVQNLAQYMFLHQSTLDLLSSKGNSQSIWFVNYSALEKMDSLDAMEGDIELEWEETTM